MFRGFWKFLLRPFRWLLGRDVPKPPSDPALENDYYYPQHINHSCIVDIGKLPEALLNINTNRHSILQIDNPITSQYAHHHTQIQIQIQREAVPPKLLHEEEQRRPTPKLPLISSTSKCVIKKVGVEKERRLNRPIISTSAQCTKRGSLGPYSWEQKILVVGDGDFSFSASLALAFGDDASNIIATSLNSFEFLMANYAKAKANITELTIRSCKVMHEVDATKMVRHPLLCSLKFDCIVYNFPHAGFDNRNASRSAQISKHQALVRGFLGNAKLMIKKDGKIHITHKCTGFHLEWNLEMLGESQGLRLVEESPFNYRLYPGYSTKYGYGGDKNFNCRPSKMYKFTLPF